jgi:hypothetical protein
MQIVKTMRKLKIIFIHTKPTTQKAVDILLIIIFVWIFADRQIRVLIFSCDSVSFYFTLLLVTFSTFFFVAGMEKREFRINIITINILLDIIGSVNFAI